MFYGLLHGGGPGVQDIVCFFQFGFAPAVQGFLCVLGPGLCFAVRIAYGGSGFAVRIAHRGLRLAVRIAHCGLCFAHRGFYLADRIAGPGLHPGDRAGHCLFGAAEFCFCPACNPVTAGVREVHRVVFCIGV